MNWFPLSATFVTRACNFSLISKQSHNSLFILWYLLKADNFVPFLFVLTERHMAEAMSATRQSKLYTLSGVKVPKGAKVGIVNADQLKSVMAECRAVKLPEEVRAMGSGSREMDTLVCWRTSSTPIHQMSTYMVALVEMCMPVIAD